MTKADADLVASHVLSVSFERTLDIVCRLSCATCGNVVFTFVYGDLTLSQEEAEGRAVENGKKVFIYECSHYLAKSVMEE